MGRGTNTEEGVRISKEHLALLRPLAEAAGVEIPGLVQHLPTVELDQPVIDLARQLGGLCSRQPIFRQADNLVALDDEGRMRAMTTDRFGSWVEKFVTTTGYTKDRGRHAATMPKDLAAKVMATDGFQVQIRPLSSWFPVRLPVDRGEGVVELLEPGYDAQTQSWTEDGIEYDTEWDLDRAVDWLHDLLGEWPFADTAALKVPKLHESRDAATILAGMLGCYMRAMLRPGMQRPMGVVSGNQAGTGKTTLCKLMVAPVHGLPAEQELPRAEEKFSRLLDSVALGMKPILYLDDVGGMIRSHALNKFVTASVHGGTRMYTQDTFEVPQVTQVFASGIDLGVDENVKRRVLWCELFLPGEVQDREFKMELTSTAIADEEFRGKCLSMLWAFVREWAVWRQIPRPKDAPKRKVLKSFEVYCRLVGGVVEMLGWADPFLEAPGTSGGDEEGRDFKKLLTRLADELGTETAEFSVNDLIEKARELGLLEWLVGSNGDKDLDKKERIRWGKRLGKYRGRIMQRTDGCYFEFGKRDGQGGSIYPCRLARDARELYGTMDS